MATANSIKLPSPAKVNHFLHIVGRRNGGYHLLQTCFQFLTLADEMEFTPTQDGKISIDFPLPIAMEQNLIYRAATALKALPQISPTLGCHIKVSKNIPIGGGLGGGSSNAGTTLLALNHLWQLGLTTKQLITIAATLGADVPIFVYGQAAFGEGIGELLTPLKLPESWVVLVIPSVHVSTRAVLSHPDLPRDTACMAALDYQFGMGHNDCELVSRQLYPEVDAAMRWLNQHAPAKLTGTGATVFTCVNSEQHARKIAESAPKSLATAIAHSINLSPARRAIDELIRIP